MGFREVKDLNCDITISLGGVNRKTGKKNPTSIEGYFLGSREITDQKKQSGVSYIHVFDTGKNTTGVWGKTDLDRKMSTIASGTMTRASFDRMVATAKGEMYKFKVEVDETNTISVDSSRTVVASTEDSSFEDRDVTYEEESSLDEEETPADEVQTPPTHAQLRVPSAEAQAKARALLGGNRRPL